MSPNSTTSTSQAGTGTVRITRVIKAPRKRVYDAFLDPDAVAKWLPPGGYTAKVHHWDAKVGGTWRMSFTSLDKKDHHAFGGAFVELKPHDRIRYTDKFETDHPDMQGTITVTITFKDAPGGTEVHVVQEGIPRAIPVEGAQQGWGMSMENLARLVEAPA